jgi:hypothetical protein
MRWARPDQYPKLYGRAPVRTNYKLVMKRPLFAEQKIAALHVSAIDEQCRDFYCRGSTRAALHCCLRQNRTHLLRSVGGLFKSAKLTFVSETDCWRDGSLYPLAGRRRAPRWIIPEL